MTTSTPSALASPPTWTSPPGGARWIALYDGHCRFCTTQARKLARLAGAERVATRSFQEPGALARFPGLSYDACMKRIHVVRPDGRVFAGGEALARIAALVPVVGLLAFLYYVPGVRQVVEIAYRAVARHRYRIAARECDGSCALHG